MEWTDLRFFLAAVRGGNLSAAARELGVNYTTVGRRLDALQHGLGATLIQRTPDGLTLTRAGEAVKERLNTTTDLLFARIALAECVGSH